MSQHGWDWQAETWDSWSEHSGHSSGWWGKAYDWWEDRSSKNWDEKPSSSLTTLQSILQRGHTVDQLQDWELQEVVASIDRMQKERKNSAEASNPAGKEQAAADAQSSGKENKEISKTESEWNKKEEKEKSAEQLAAEALQKQQEQPDPARASTGKPESKDDRRKRLHARNMRYYRSLSSHLDCVNS